MANDDVRPDGDQVSGKVFPVHQLIASKVSFLDEAMLSYFLVVCELAPSHPIVFSFRGFDFLFAYSRCAVSSVQPCTTATLTLPSRASQQPLRV